MNALLNELVAQVDLLESQRTQSFGWKPHFDRIIDEIAVVSASVEDQGENSGNALFRLLSRQQQLLMDLVLLSQISALEK